MLKKKDVKALVAAIRDQDVPTVRALVEATPELVGATASAPPKKDDGQSPLQIALKCGQSAIADLLIDRGADVNFIETSEINEWRIPVLHDAIRNAIVTLCYGGDLGARADAGLAILDKLLGRGADPNGRDSYGNNALMRAVLDGKMALDPIRPKPTEALRSEKVGKVVAALIQAGADAHAPCQRGESALDAARGTLMERFFSGDSPESVAAPEPCTPYSPSLVFKEGDRLAHPTLGEGWVRRVSGDKIEVEFHAGRKTLLHARR